MAGAGSVAPHELDIEGLYRRFHRRAFAIAWAYLRDEDDAADAVQEAFVRAKRSIATFNGRSHPHTWLSRIVVNVCLDVRRHRRRRPELHVEDVDAVESPSCSDATPERSLQAIELRAALAEGLRRLSADHRQVIVMRELSGLDYEQMAIEGRCPKGTVMSRLFHARRKLRHWLGRRLDVDMLVNA